MYSIDQIIFSQSTSLLIGGAAILISLVLLVSKSRRKKHGTSRPTSLTSEPISDAERLWNDRIKEQNLERTKKLDEISMSRHGSREQRSREQSKVGDELELLHKELNEIVNEQEHDLEIIKELGRQRGLEQVCNEAKSTVRNAESALQGALSKTVNISQSTKQLIQDSHKALAADDFSSAKVYARRSIENINVSVKEFERQKEEQARKEYVIRELEQLRSNATELIKDTNKSLEKAKNLGIPDLQNVEHFSITAKNSFEANKFAEAKSDAQKCKNTIEKLIEESEPNITLKLPSELQYNYWRHHDITITNNGKAHAKNIAISFSKSLETTEMKKIPKLNVGEKQTLQINMKPTEAGDVPIDYIIKFSDLQDRTYEIKNTTTIQTSIGTMMAQEGTMSSIDDIKTDSNKLDVLREPEFFNGFIRLKISIQNNMQYIATDVFLDLDYDENILRLDHHEPNTYATKKGKIQFGNIAPNSDKSIAFYFDPLICSKKGTVINCRIDYKDASGILHSVRMEPSKKPIVCPIFKTEQDINIGRLKELVASLPAKSSKLFSIPSGINVNKALILCCEVIQMHDVCHVRTFKTTDDKTYEIWYYGKTEVEMIDLVIKASVSEETKIIEVFVAAPNQKVLTGLLAELGRNISKRGEALGKPAQVFNFSIKDSQISRSNLLDACDINGICDGNVVIENSWVRRSNIASNANNVNIHIKDNSIVQRSTIGPSTKKCPNCGIEVEDEQKFCLECGAKL